MRQVLAAILIALGCLVAHEMGHAIAANLQGQPAEVRFQMYMFILRGFAVSPTGKNPLTVVAGIVGEVLFLAAIFSWRGGGPGLACLVAVRVLYNLLAPGSDGAILGLPSLPISGSIVLQAMQLFLLVEAGDEVCRGRRLPRIPMSLHGYIGEVRLPIDEYG